MVCVKRVVLDVLKPHHPSVIEFAQTLAEIGADYEIRLSVIEMDENTETVQVEVTGGAIDFEVLQASISKMGGSLHSIDEVDVKSSSENK